MRALRVLLVQGERLYRLELEKLLRDTPGFVLAGSFQTSLAAREWIARESEGCFEVALIDISPPHVLGIELTQELRCHAPDATLVMLTAVENPQTIHQAICAGADGYLLKHSSGLKIVSQIRAAVDG